MEILLQQLAPAQIYHLMTQTIIPRPIAWVLTENTAAKKDRFNLAPFSYFSAVCSDPPLLMISVGKKSPGVDKDTVRNSQLGTKAVVHIAHQDQYKDVTQSAATLNYGESELNSTGVTLTQFDRFEMPRLMDCPVAFGCKVHSVQHIGNTPQTLVFYEIETVFVDDKLVSGSPERLTIDAMQLAPLNRLGAAQYGTLGSVIEQKRPK